MCEFVHAMAYPVRWDGGNSATSPPKKKINNNTNDEGGMQNLGKRNMMNNMGKFMRRKKNVFEVL